MSSKIFRPSLSKVTGRLGRATCKLIALKAVQQLGFELVIEAGRVTDSEVLSGDEPFRAAAQAEVHRIHLPALAWPGRVIKTVRPNAPTDQDDPDDLLPASRPETATYFLCSRRRRRDFNFGSGRASRAGWLRR